MTDTVSLRIFVTMAVRPSGHTAILRGPALTRMVWVTASVWASMTETEDDLASANAKLAVLASLAGFIASPLAVGLLQLGAPWVLRLAFVVFLLGGVAAVRLPKSADVLAPGPAAPPDPGSLGGWPVSGGVQGQPDAGKPLYERSARSDRDRQARIDVARERQRLGLPLYSPDVVLGLATMSVMRSIRNVRQEPRLVENARI